MSTFSSNIGPEEEDGAGWSGLVASKTELREEASRRKLEQDAERYRWLRKNTIVLGIFHYQIDDELEELVDGRIAAARAALKEYE